MAKKIRRFEVKNKIESWLKKVKKLYGYSDEEFNKLWRFADDDNPEFKKTDRFLFYFDGCIYEVINYYQSDGYNPCGLGEKFDNLTDGTEWMWEFQEYSVIIFFKDF